MELPATVSALARAPSEAVRQAAAAALRACATHYTDRAGIPALRSSLVASLGAAPPIEDERVILTTGRQESLFLALCGHAQAGGRTVVAADRCDRDLVQSLGLTFKRGYSDDSELDDGGLLLIYSSRGDVDRHAIAQALCAGARVVIGESLACDEDPYPSLAAAGLAEHVLIAGDLDRAGLARWGAGYLIGPQQLIAPLVDLKQGLNICTAGLAQHAAVAAVAQRSAAAGASAPTATFIAPTVRRAANQSSARPSPTLSDEGTRQRYELLDLLTATDDAITLGRGDPDLATPPQIVDAAINAMSLRPAEPDSKGLASLRAAIASKLARDNGVLVDPRREVLVTTGGQEAIFLLLQVLTAPGDEILMPGPRYTTYDVGVNLRGATIVTVAPNGPLDFSLNVAALEAQVTSRTRALLIITPGNPTASVADRQTLMAVAVVARRHDLVVISDEMYERITYPGVEHVSMASLPGMAERTVTVGGFSKTYAMTGWRIGYMAGPAKIIDQVDRLKQLWSGTTSEISQRAALAALQSADDLAAEGLAEYVARRSIALGALDRMGLPYAPVQGAFYAFFDVSALGLHSYELSRRLLTEAGVFLYPGSGFGPEWSDYMRMAWLQPKPRLEQALERMELWIQKQR